MAHTKKGRKVALVAGLALVVLTVAMVSTYWKEIRFFLKFEELGLNEQGYPEFRHRQTAIVMVRVPGGTFFMGSPGTELDRERIEGPVHEVTLSSILIAKHEVTQKQWEKAMGTRTSKFTGDELPVENVSWEDCKEFCRRTGLALPTEAQWEYACRAGSGTTYHSGNTNIDLKKVGWYRGNSGGKTHAVGSKTVPNDFGLHDMHGNVLEWCEDVYDSRFYEKPEAMQKDPVCTSGSGGRVLRGGGWVSVAGDCRSACRDYNVPSGRGETLGFRAAWSSP